MKKRNRKMVLHLLVSIGISFLVIYLFIFFGGWQLFEAGDPILYEIGAALGIGLIIWLIYEVTVYYDARMKELEKRILELENKSTKTEETTHE